jgi:hypothetical protein
MASLEVFADVGGQGFTERSTLDLPVGAAHSVKRTLTLRFSAKIGRMLCAAVRAHPSRLHLYANHLIDAGNRRYGMQTSQTLTMRRCAT